MIYNFISLSVLNSFLCVILETLCGVSVCLRVFVVYWVTYVCIICAFVCVWVWVCVHMCRGHRMTGVLFYESLPYCLEPEARLATSNPRWCSCFHPRHCWAYKGLWPFLALYTGARDLNSGPHVNIVSTLHPLRHLPSPLCILRLIVYRPNKSDNI